MGVYIKQLLAGRDFAMADRFATGMANFIYLIGDTESRECVVVDPAWDIDGIRQRVSVENMRLVGALATHYHPDHVGGEIFGHRIAGIAELLEKEPVKVHVQSNEKQGLKQVTGASDSDLVTHSGGDVIKIGSIEITLLHTPGHTPGSQCFLVGSSLVSGDTLFIGGCGRVDLPGGDPEQMYHSLTQVLARLPAETIVYPGHDYADRETSTIGEERTTNYYLKMNRLEDWMTLMGAR